MDSHPTRARRGELLAAAAALVLLVLVFVAKWYGPGFIANHVSVRGTVNGWHGLLHLRWLILVTVAAGLLLGIVSVVKATATWRAGVDGMVTLLGLASVVWLGYRVLISIPPGEKATPYVGLACTVAIVLGAGVATWDSALASARARRRLGGETAPPTAVPPSQPPGPPPATEA